MHPLDVNKYFFFLFIFSLLFVIVLYSLIGFQYIDEICVLLLFVLFFLTILNTPQWEFNKVFLISLGVFLFYAIYSLIIGSNSPRAIFNDFVINLKPYLGFFCVYQLKVYFDESKKKLLKEISLLIWFVFLLPVGLISIFDDNVIVLTLTHPANLAIVTIIVSLCYLYSSNFTKRDKTIFLVILSIGIISGKSKFYGFFTLSIFLIFFLNIIRQLKMNLKSIFVMCSMLTIIIIVAWQKISLYFFDALINIGDKKGDMIARFVLYRTFPEILRDYFPFGSGFASYATHSSGEYYSGLYAKYGIENVYGISKHFCNFISDTYYPSLAQFGVVGIILFILFWAYIIKKAIRLYKRSGYTLSKHLVLVLMIIGFIAIECTTGSAFIAQGGFFVMMMIGMILSDMQKACFDYESTKYRVPDFGGNQDATNLN